MRLDDLVEALRAQDKHLRVKWGFRGPGHSDRGDYANLAFPQAEDVSVGEMLEAVYAMVGKTITGYKGGDFLVDEYTKVLIGEDSGVCGEEVTPLLMRYMFHCGYPEHRRKVTTLNPGQDAENING